MHFKETIMKKIFSKLGVVGLLSLMLLSFTQTGVSNEVFDITKETVLVAEQRLLRARRPHLGEP